jgi:hypothetical protein
LTGHAASRPETIDQVSVGLVDWAQRTVRDLTISLEPPGAPLPEQGVSLYLLEILRVPSLRGPRRPPLQLDLRYLVTTWHPDPQEAQHALSQLVFAALESEDFEVEESPVPLDLWPSFGVAPRPCFVLRYPLRVERHELAAPLVREARFDPILSRTTLYGQLFVPGAGPSGEAINLAGARIEAAGGRRSATSDGAGRFCLENVRADRSGAIRLTVHARGQTFEEMVSETGSPAAPVAIEVPLPIGRLEGRIEDRTGVPVAGVRIEIPSRRQFTHSRADGRFLLDGLPVGLGPGQIAASSGGEPLEIRVEDGTVVLKADRASSSTERITIDFSS